MAGSEIMQALERGREQGWLRAVAFVSKRAGSAFVSRNGEHAMALRVLVEEMMVEAQRERDESSTSTSSKE